MRESPSRDTPSAARWRSTWPLLQKAAPPRPSAPPASWTPWKNWKPYTIPDTPTRWSTMSPAGDLFGMYGRHLGETKILRTGCCRISSCLSPALHSQLGPAGSCNELSHGPLHRSLSPLLPTQPGGSCKPTGTVTYQNGKRTKYQEDSTGPAWQKTSTSDRVAMPHPIRTATYCHTLT